MVSASMIDIVPHGIRLRGRSRSAASKISDACRPLSRAVRRRTSGPSRQRWLGYDRDTASGDWTYTAVGLDGNHGNIAMLPQTPDGNGRLGVVT